MTSDVNAGETRRNSEWYADNSHAELYFTYQSFKNGAQSFDYIGAKRTVPPPEQLNPS